MMNYSLLIGIILLTVVSRANSMNEEEPKKNIQKKHSIKILNLPQGSTNSGVTSPRIGQSPRLDSPKKISPKTDECLEKIAIPRKFSNPKAVEEKK